MLEGGTAVKLTHFLIILL